MALHDALIEHPDEPIPTEFHVPDGDGRRWVEATWTNQLHEPAVNGFVGNLRDITDRKRANAFGGRRDPRLRAHPLRRAGPGDAARARVRARDLHPRRRRVPSGSSIPRPRMLRSVAAPSLPAAYVAEVSKHTTENDIAAFLSATETRVLTRHRARGRARRPQRALPRARAPGHVVGADPLARRLRVPRPVRLLPAHRARAAPERAGDPRARPRPRRARHRPRRAHAGARSSRAARHPDRAPQPRARAGPPGARARTSRPDRRGRARSRCCSSTSTASSW